MTNTQTLYLYIVGSTGCKVFFLPEVIGMTDRP